MPIFLNKSQGRQQADVWEKTISIEKDLKHLINNYNDIMFVLFSVKQEIQHCILKRKKRSNAIK